MQTAKTYGRYAVALTAALGLFMAVLDNTIVNVALTPMANKLNTSLNSIQWVIAGYFLAQAAVIPVAGYFANRFGVKRLFIISLTLFTIGNCSHLQSTSFRIRTRHAQTLRRANTKRGFFLIFGRKCEQLPRSARFSAAWPRM